MLKFEPLASSSSGCAYRLSGGGAAAPLLIDAGLTFDALRKALDFQVSKLAGCLISHAHGDHTKAVDKLLAASVDIYASAETWVEFCPGLIHHRAHCVYPREEQKVGDWSVLPFEAVHDSPGALGFVITSPENHRLLYLTDSVYSPYRFEGLTHLAVECNHSLGLIRKNAECGQIDRKRYVRTVRTHMSLERLLDMLAANDLSKVQEIHLLHLSNENSNEEEFKLAVQRAVGRPVYVAAERRIEI